MTVNLMEKGRPHYKLPTVRALIDVRRVRVTTTALAGAAAIGMGFDDMIEVIRKLRTGDFHKSMTSHADHRIWQNVYRPTTPAGGVYLKLTVNDSVVIVSFKEL